MRKKYYNKGTHSNNLANTVQPNSEETHQNDT